MIQEYKGSDAVAEAQESVERLPYEAPSVVVRSFTRKSHRLGANCTHFAEDVEYR